MPADLTCPGCRLPLDALPGPTGRPRRYHGAACRQRAHRGRAVTKPPPSAVTKPAGPCRNCEAAAGVACRGWCPGASEPGYR